MLFFFVAIFALGIGGTCVLLVRTNAALRRQILERRKVEKEVLEISEQEQQRFGMHLHDDLCQSLTGIMMFAKVLTRKMAQQDFPEAAELEKLCGLLDQSITQAREMARGYYPVELQADSFMMALRDLAQRTQKLYGVSCHFFCPTPIFIEDNNCSTHLYRIAQEAVRNAVKHGAAQHVDILLQQKKGRVNLLVQDDGEGFSNGNEQSDGIGFHIMKYRARMINARLAIAPAQVKGTVLTCSLAARRSCGSDKEDLSC